MLQVSHRAHTAGASSFGVEVFCPSRCRSFYHNGSRVRKEILVSDCYPLSYRRQRVLTEYALAARLTIRKR